MAPVNISGSASSSVQKPTSAEWLYNRGVIENDRAVRKVESRTNRNIRPSSPVAVAKLTLRPPSLTAYLVLLNTVWLDKSELHAKKFNHLLICKYKNPGYLSAAGVFHSVGWGFTPP